MKEFIKNLNDKLGECEKGYTDEYGMIDIQTKEVFVKIRKIVNQFAEEYNNGWILCSERLPSENGKYLVCVSNPTRCNKNNIFAFWYNEYDKEFERENDLDYVIAWQPLPEPYQKKKSK